MEKITPKYVMKKYNINITSINDFYIYEAERRKLRLGKIKQIVSQFNKSKINDKHFDSPLVVSKKDKIRILDGNHRIEAIKYKLSTTPTFEIDVWMAVYSNLNREQERLIYSKWNKGTPENATDYLKWHYNTIPEGETLLQKLPVTIYGSKNKLKIKDLVGAHIDAKKQTTFQGGYSANGEKTVRDFKTLTYDDVKQMALFCDYMSEIFGKFVKNSPYYRTTPFQSFYRIWYDNYLIMTRKTFINAFKSVFLNRWGEINELSSHGGRSACLSFYRLSIDRLNNYRKKINFVTKLKQ